eukprot:6211819-Pleurochrysis_carterae.AAC.2
MANTSGAAASSSASTPPPSTPVVVLASMQQATDSSKARRFCARAGHGRIPQRAALEKRTQTGEALLLLLEEVSNSEKR